MDHSYLRRHGAASCAYDSAVSRSASARHPSLYFAKAGAKKCTCATWKGECSLTVIIMIIRISSESRTCSLKVIIITTIRISSESRTCSLTSRKTCRVNAASSAGSVMRSAFAARSRSHQQDRVDLYR